MNVIGMAREPSWQEEGWAIPATIEEFTRLHSDFHRDALDLMHAISPGTLFKWGLRDREPLQLYTKGRVTMLGDAAHPMTPFLGQGACVAIEDAMVLGRAFEAASTFGEAFGTYENTRKARANGVQLASRQQADKIQGARKGDQIREQPPMIAAYICIIPSQSTRASGRDVLKQVIVGSGASIRLRLRPRPFLTPRNQPDHSAAAREWVES